MSDQIPKHIKRLSLKEIRDIIISLKCMDLHNTEVDLIKEKITLLITGYIINTPFIPKGEYFYRGVIRDAKPQNVSDLTYPDSARITYYQRANRPNSPLFYCSTSRDVPFFELDLQPQDHVAVSKWRTEGVMIVNNIGYTASVLGNLGSGRVLPGWSGNKPSLTNTEENRLINQYLSEEFTKVVPNGKEALHKITVAIAEKLMSGGIIHKDGTESEFAGIIYPTIAMKGNADNLAIKPSIVDKLFEIEEVEYIHINERPSKYEYKVAIMDFANTFSPDGQIEWKGRRPQWKLKKKWEMLTFAVENGRWVARNSEGEIVPPD